jgi:hypothetical protein
MGDTKGFVWLKLFQALVGDEMMTVATNLNHQLVVDEVKSAVPRFTTLLHRVHIQLPERVRARRSNVRGELHPAFIRLRPNDRERAPTWESPSSVLS